MYQSKWPKYCALEWSCTVKSLFLSTNLEGDIWLSLTYIYMDTTYLCKTPQVYKVSDDETLFSQKATKFMTIETNDFHRNYPTCPFKLFSVNSLLTNLITTMFPDVFKLFINIQSFDLLKSEMLHVHAVYVYLCLCEPFHRLPKVQAFFVRRPIIICNYYMCIQNL